ncbi:MAG: hypothetical protein BWK78_01435 [Thiotrichaceae bacterium IS1]|nr:MAG: hypothetical protein BWK78_01435 [Thiotrichaceae bacterium IS1]
MTQLFLNLVDWIKNNTPWVFSGIGTAIAIPVAVEYIQKPPPPPQFRLSYEKVQDKVHLYGILTDGDVLKPKDSMRIYFYPLQEESYVYVLTQNTAGKCTVEFPNEHQKNPVDKEKEYYIHKHFDDKKDGSITIFFQAHTKPVDNLERRQASKDDCRELGKDCKKDGCYEDRLKLKFEFTGLQFSTEYTYIRRVYYGEKWDPKPPIPLEAGDELTSKDLFQIRFRPSQESYVYVLIQDTEGKCTIEFPNENKQNPVNKEEYYVFPFPKQFDDKKDGDITIFFQAHIEPVDNLEKGGSSKDNCKELGENCKKGDCFEDTLKFKFAKN